jgi:hypothetical protein
VKNVSFNHPDQTSIFVSFNILTSSIIPCFKYKLKHSYSMTGSVPILRQKVTGNIYSATPNTKGYRKPLYHTCSNFYCKHKMMNKVQGVSYSKHNTPLSESCQSGLEVCCCHMRHSPQRLRLVSSTKLWKSSHLNNFFLSSSSFVRPLPCS